MLKGLEHETVLVKMVMAIIAAAAVVLSLIFLMGINLITCNPLALTFGVACVAVLFWICSLI